MSLSKKRRFNNYNTNGYEENFMEQLKNHYETVLKQKIMEHNAYYESKIINIVKENNANTAQLKLENNTLIKRCELLNSQIDLLHQQKSRNNYESSYIN